MMKVLRIITRLNVGGPAQQAIDLNRELGELGYEVYLMFGAVDCDEMEIDKPVYGQHIFNPFLKKSSSILDNFKSLYYIWKWIRVIKPDIVHTHMSKAGFLGRLATLFLRPRPKVIHTFHGHVFYGYFGRWKTRLIIIAERWLAKITDVVIAISKSQRDDLIEKYKISCYGRYGRIKTIPLGFNLDELLEMEPFEFNPSRPLRVGIIGRLTAIKNHELFFDFINELSLKISVDGYVVGNGERLNVLVWYVEGKRLSNVVSFTDWIFDKRRIYENLDIVVCSSLNEGTPVSLIEAMAAGRIVISTPVGGVMDLLEVEEDSWDLVSDRGFVLEQFNITKSVNGLVEGLRNGSYKSKLIAAREYVKKNHSLDRLVSDIDRLYKEVTDG